MSEDSEFKVKLDLYKIEKLKWILDDLYKARAIKSTEVEEFIRFTLFIVLDEFDKNPSSLRSFYKGNLQNYLKSK